MDAGTRGRLVSGRFVRALAGEPLAVPPVWCMRQAGRYQRAYQAFRRRHSFEALCRDPELAAKVALAAVDDFDFDAAILFSDLLFPLQALGFGLSYDDGGPKLNRRLTPEFLARLRPAAAAVHDLAFQAAAVSATRRQLPADKGLIGFIGGPWTLFVYAVEGTHAGSLAQAKSSPALYRRFARVMVPLLEQLARAQLAAGADLVMVFDTAAGELAPPVFRRQVLPDLERLANSSAGRLGYYARNLHPAHLGHESALTGRWNGLGVDWRWDLAGLLARSGRRGFVQGNFDPGLLHLSGAALGRAIDEFLAPIAALPPADRRGWICGLGHGVLPGTPELSMRTFVRTIRRRLG
jgi:uroporphyrinogen decarboxylase